MFHHNHHHSQHNHRMLHFNNRTTSSSLLSIKFPLLISVTVISFLAGSLWSSLFHHVACSSTTTTRQSSNHKNLFSSLDAAQIEQEVQQRLVQELKRRGCQDKKSKSHNHNNNNEASSSTLSQQLPSSMSRFAVGMVRTTKKDFVTEIEMGVPLNADVEPGQEDVLLIYSSQKALPTTTTKFTRRLNDQQEGEGGEEEEIDEESNSSSGGDGDGSSTTTGLPLISTKSALENCDYLNIILTDGTGQRRQCVAVVPQYEAYHIQKWMRAPYDRDGNIIGPMNSKLPLTLVSRGYQANGRHSFRPPRLGMDTRPHWNFLTSYLTILDDLLNRLRPIAQRIASPKHTIIVMVCNHGQSELLMNFVCTAQRRNLTISNTLVFATDQATYDLATSMGLAAFLDDRVFGSMPSEEARAYGDKKFTAMMMAKVICVHLISMLGYNILFQDVDMVWYKHPLSYFEDDASKKTYFDMYFQDDGGHSVRYAPLSANSGFYYIRHNDKTVYFMNALLMSGDLVTRTKSHQQAMIALLNEHTSLFGLRVKVLSRDEPEFPGGFHYHQKSAKYMKDFFAGKVDPYIFHMSWTLNKANKVLFLRQMGDWYLQDVCISKTVDDIVTTLQTQDNAAAASIRSPTDPGALVQPCCALEPLISCHYRDKPSKIPCRKSPPIDKGKRSFW